MIELYTSDAINTILPFFIFGFSVGFFYDLFSAFRITFKSFIVLFLSDFLFPIITATAYFLLVIGYLRLCFFGIRYLFILPLFKGFYKANFCYFSKGDKVFFKIFAKSLNLSSEKSENRQKN